MDQQVDNSYTGSGFNQFLERSPQMFSANERINGMISPFLDQADQNGYLFSPFGDTTSQTTDTLLSQQPISANNVQGGTFTSDDGNLTIDLTNGNIQYTDGAQQLFNLGGENAQGQSNSLTINNSNGQQILGS